MIALVLIISLAYAWLLFESKFLSMRLLVGIEAKPITDLDILEVAQRIGWTYKNGHRAYKDWLIPMCGWEWVIRHEHDLDTYQPKVQMTMGGVRYNMTIKQPSIIKDIMRVNKLTKKQKLVYV